MSYKKENRINQFNELKELMECGIYEDLQLSVPRIITPNNLKEIKPQTTSINHIVQFAEENVINAINKSKNAAVLIFCSAKNPGGGVQQGSLAQEEEISLRSSWFFQIKDLKGFYLGKGANALNTDNVIYIEKGYLLKNEIGEDIEPLPISFIGSTAPNLNGIISQGHSVNSVEIQNMMEQRIENVLKIAQKYQKSELILGAWGCGVFGLENEMVAQAFKKKIEENWFTGKITFSILDKNTLEVFRKIICGEKPKERVANKRKA